MKIASKKGRKVSFPTESYVIAIRNVASKHNKCKSQVEQTVFNITAPIFREIARKPFFTNSL